MPRSAYALPPPLAGYPTLGNERRRAWVVFVSVDRGCGDSAARRYHEQTKHAPQRLSASRYGLDWHNEPHPFKRYPNLEPERPPAELDRLLRLGAGVHPRRGDPRFRTFMSAGALHPVELYLATASGVSHFHPGEGTLRRLRDEDARAALAHAAAEPDLARAAAVLGLTGILWRTSWKYGARGWRHLFWDAGAMLANLLVLAAEAGLDPRLLTAFVDQDTADALGVDPPREAPVALLAVGRATPASGPQRLGPVEHDTPPLSRRERRFPEAEEAQAGSALATADEVRAWRQAAARFPNGTRSPSLHGSSGGDELPGPLAETIIRRGSARDFTSEPVASNELDASLASACAAVPGDLPSLCSTFVIAHAVDGLEPGAYRLEPGDRFELLHDRVSRRRTAHLCLDQPHGGNAAAVIFFTSDLDRVLSELGDRGYRAAQLDAGIRAGRTSLAAYARGLGATGLTFYDDEVRDHLGTNEEPMMCVAVGVDAHRPRMRR